MGSIPVYVPPKLKSSATTKAIDCQQQENKTYKISNKQTSCEVEDRQQNFGLKYVCDKEEENPPDTVPLWSLM